MNQQQTRPKSRAQVLFEELQKLDDYGCQDVLLIDGDGLIVAAAQETDSARDTAALAAQMMQIANRTTVSATVEAGEEVSVRTGQGLKLVCRNFKLGAQPVSLVCTLPHRRAHRRATNQAIQAIQYAWTGGQNGSAR